MAWARHSPEIEDQARGDEEISHLRHAVPEPKQLLCLLLLLGCGSFVYLDMTGFELGLIPKSGE